MTTRIARHASKKASTSININSRVHFFSNSTESDVDETINYSLQYSEENSIIEEVGDFECLVESSEHENTFKRYYIEKTPFETSVHFSTSTSSSDVLKLKDSKPCNALQTELKLKKYIIADEAIGTIKEKLKNSKKIAELKSYMEFKNKEIKCENTEINIFSSDNADFEEKCDDERLEKIINVTPSQSPIELCDNNREGKIVTFSGEDNYSQQTPLMFSRCSSLGSLSGYEQQSLHDDRSSIISDFSRRTSEVVSPCDLTDSSIQFTNNITQQKEKKILRKRIQHRDKLQYSEPFPHPEISKRSIFEDDLAVFKEESTPVKLLSVAASSLSSLTIDDDDYIDERDRGEARHKAGVIKTLKTVVQNDQICTDEDEKKNISNQRTFEDNPFFFGDEEQILDEYIRKGIAKVTRQHVNDVTSFNLQGTNSQTLNESGSEKSCENIEATENTLKLFDENTTELTAEEEKLLDECIRRGIAKVTRQNINDVTSLSLHASSSRHSNIKDCSKE